MSEQLSNASETQTLRSGALQGLRVIDMSRVLAGPFCAQMLADHGADVIKVEPPEGDETRAWGPPFHEESSSYFTGINRNKRDIALDLSTSQGRDVLLRLLQDADVVIENFKLGTLERWNLSYEEVLSVAFPKLIHCRVTAYGSEGPMAALPGYDGMVQAWSGLMSVNGTEETGPLRVGVPIIDIVTAHNAAFGIMLALNERARSGKGQSIEVALYDTALSILHPHAASWLDSGQEPKLTGNHHPTIAPYGLFETKTGKITIGAGNNKAFEKLCAALGVPELAKRPEFSSNSARLKNQALLDGLLSDQMKDVDGQSLTLRLMSEGLPAGAVMSVGEALNHPQTRDRGRVAKVGKYQGIDAPVRLSRTPASVRSAPPKYAEHTASILAEHGYATEEIESLVESGVTPAKPPSR